MGIISKIKKRAKRSAKKAKQTAKRAKQGAEKAKDTVKDTSRNATKKVKRIAVEVAGEVQEFTEEQLAKNTENAVADVFGKIKEEVFNKIERELLALSDKVQTDIASATNAAVRKFPELVEQAAKKLAEEASKQSVKKALDLAIDIIEGTQPDTYTIIFGIELALVIQGEITVSLELSNPVGRISKIKEWVKKPPHGRSQIIQCVKDFGPESISAEFKISGNGGSSNWSGEKAYDSLDSFLKKNGV